MLMLMLMLMLVIEPSNLFGSTGASSYPYCSR